MHIFFKKKKMTLLFPALHSAIGATPEDSQMNRSAQNERVVKVLNFHHDQLTGVKVKATFVAGSL